MSKFLFKVVLDATDPDQVHAAANFLQALAGAKEPLKQTTTAAKVEKTAGTTAAALAKEKPAKETAKKAADKKAEEQATTDTQEAAEETQEATNSVDLVTVRELLSKLVQKHREEIKAKLDELGAKSLTVLEPSKYGEFYEFLQTLK